MIAAASNAGVKLLLYTSVLRADSSALGVAVTHRKTESDLRASGLPFAILRNGWYTENDTASLAMAVATGALLGSAGGRQIASATREDYADVAAVALLDGVEAGRVFKLAGDEAYTLSQLAAEVARQSGKPVAYRNLSETDFKAALLAAGVPEVGASVLSGSDAERPTARCLTMVANSVR